MLRELVKQIALSDCHESGFSPKERRTPIRRSSWIGHQWSSCAFHGPRMIPAIQEIAAP